MQDATEAIAAGSEVTQSRATDEEATLSAAAAEKLHASPDLTFDFESLLRGPSHLPDPLRQSMEALKPPCIRLQVTAAKQDVQSESSLLHHLSSLEVRGQLTVEIEAPLEHNSFSQR